MISWAISFKYIYTMAQFQDEDVPLVNDRLGFDSTLDFR